jgi:hypothetical protein
VGAYPVLEKRLLSRYEPLVIVAWGYLFGSALTLMSVIPCAADPAAWHVSPAGIGAAFFAGIATSAFNYTAMNRVNQVTSPAFIMSFYPLQSLLTPALALAILGSPVRVQDVVGGLIIIAGLALLLTTRWWELRGLAQQQAQAQAEGEGEHGPGGAVVSVGIGGGGSSEESRDGKVAHIGWGSEVGEGGGLELTVTEPRAAGATGADGAAGGTAATTGGSAWDAPGAAAATGAR